LKVDPDYIDVDGEDSVTEMVSLDEMSFQSVGGSETGSALLSEI